MAMRMKRKPILDGQPGALRPGNYRFVCWLGDGEAIFQDSDGGPREVFAARTNGHAGWGLHWRGTSWEFCRSID